MDISTYELLIKSEAFWLAIWGIDFFTNIIFVQICSFSAKFASCCWVLVCPTTLLNIWYRNACIKLHTVIGKLVGKTGFALWAIIKPCWVLTICNNCTTFNKEPKFLRFIVNNVTLFLSFKSRFACRAPYSCFINIESNVSLRVSSIMSFKYVVIIRLQ